MLLDIVFVYNQNKLSGRLTKIFTGSHIYHVGFVTRDLETMYDMNLLHRSVDFQSGGHYPPGTTLVLQCPAPITEDWVLREIARLNGLAAKRNPLYGFLDYLGFAVRPLFHLFGKSTPNFSGDICSEWCNQVLRTHGLKTPWTEDAPPPSPTDLYLYVTEWLNIRGLLDSQQLHDLDLKVGHQPTIHRRTQRWQR